MTELLVRMYEWIQQSPGHGHRYTCRAWPALPMNMRDECNCGRDKLLRDAAMAFDPPRDFRPTNGGDGEPLL